ncbi:hypothetical protein ET475_13145 [Microbacterium protaetiae]|uniref:DUF559 domain-containing protein n=1 Tax=Microbacterium protaetiae TaxID=2509458 RepID=A0A4V0YDI6_9MICO|nr:hypothetical protein [Microbacterium protaetiae]QAY60841.1 hypothetical protein ET475_13145 [Microbacterium protaetiae]
MLGAPVVKQPDNDESAFGREARTLTAEILQLARAYACIMPDWAFFSHVTAAVIWGFPVPIRLLRAAIRQVRRHGHLVPARGIDVAVLGRRRASKARGVRGHELTPTQTTVRTVDGMRVLSSASTWATLADELTVDELIEMGDAIVYIPRRHGMERGTAEDAHATIEQLRAAALAPRRRNRAKLLEALELIRVGAASPFETRVRIACVRAGLPEPELDYDVIAADGTPIGFTEIAFPDQRLLIEGEGDHHRTDRAQWYRDIDKHTACEDAGWRVLRLVSTHVYPSTGPAVERITAALRRAGWSG